MKQSNGNEHVNKYIRWPEPPVIKRSEEYSDFKFKDNRDLDPRNLAKMRKLATEGKFMPHKCPILVDRNFFIKDGQHRYSTCMEFGYPVYYIMDQDDITPEEIMDLNQAGKTHTVIDRMSTLKNSQSVLGGEVRRALAFYQTHAKDYKISETLIYHLLLNFCTGEPVGNAILSGSFRINKERETLELLKWLHEFPKGAFKYEKPFIMALLDIGKACGDMGLVYIRIANRAKDVTAEPNTPAYKQMLLEVFNHGKKTKLQLKKVKPRAEDADTATPAGTAAPSAPLMN
jgi:hypothetical protein